MVLEECRYTRPDEVCVEFGLDLHAEAGAFVHSVRSTMEDSRADPRTARPTRMKKGTPPEDLYTVETQDLPDLVDVWLAFNRLYHDAWRAYVNLVTGVEARTCPYRTACRAALAYLRLNTIKNQRLAIRRARTQPRREPFGGSANDTARRRPRSSAFPGVRCRGWLPSSCCPRDALTPVAVDFLVEAELPAAMCFAITRRWRAD